MKRRVFLSGFLTASFAALCPARTALAEEKSLPSSDGWDVIVVGSGLAGLSAAVAAREAGARRVALLEKDVLIGGHSIMSSGYFNAVAHALAYRYGFAQGYSYFNTQPANSVGFFRELTEFELSNTRCNQRAFETSWGLNVPLYSTAPVEERVDVISEMLKNEQKEQAKPLDSVGKLIRVAGNIPDGTQLLVSATARATNISEASLSNKNRIATVRSNFKRLAGYE